MLATIPVYCSEYQLLTCLWVWGTGFVTGRAMAAWWALNCGGDKACWFDGIVVEFWEVVVVAVGVCWEVVVVDDGVDSCLPHPWAPGGTNGTAVSVPLCSDFKEGKLAGGRRALGTFPNDCIPCLMYDEELFCCCFSGFSP